MMRHLAGVAETLERKIRQDSSFDASVDQWWKSSKAEYPLEDIYPNGSINVLSKIILVAWINKILFANILKSYREEARSVEDIQLNTTPKQGAEIFHNISKTCNFWNVFGPQLGEECLPKEAWDDIVHLNNFLVDYKLDKLDASFLSAILSEIVNSAKRKAAGQYPTPLPLAKLMVYLTVDDKRKEIYDPFCGTGTITKAAYLVKLEYDIASDKALEAIWASDKFAFPLQLASIALTEPANIGLSLYVFKEDIVKISLGKKYKFQNPSDGNTIEKTLEAKDYIISNLPFIQQKDISKTNPDVFGINNYLKELLGEELKLPGRSDLYAYIPPILWSILKSDGKIGIITSNSWLGTGWGKVYRSILRRLFDIEYVIISGKGRWFAESDVVTTMTVLKKKNDTLHNSPTNTKFVVINKSLSEFTQNPKELATSIITGKNDLLSLASSPSDLIDFIEYHNFGWNILFSNVTWLKVIYDKLVNLNKYFNIQRGERRGWDALFYPQQRHGIESVYIKPVLKSFRNIQTLIAEPDAQAFCCCLSKEDLRKLKHKGALSWIEKFEKQFNETGKPLPEALKRSGMLWYEMSPSTMADIVASINYDKRLFFAKMRKRAFVNQRLIRLTSVNNNVDIDLCHALLNSLLGLFFLEALGFGRGLGALDLSASKIRNGFMMLNPTLISQSDIAKIKTSFRNLATRSPLPIPQELKERDRIKLDKIVFDAFGISSYKNQVEESLLQLYNLRMAVFSDENRVYLAG